MDYSKILNLKSAALLVALVMMSACSSSKLDDASGDTPETAASAEAAPAASTDAVPGVADAPPAPEGATADVDPNAAPPAPEAPAAVAENPVLTQQPAPDAVPASPVVETPIASAPVEAPSVAAPVVASDAPVAAEGGTAYRVKQGDTLMKIAFENYGDLYRWKEIYEANRSKIQDPNHVPPGTNLTLNGAGMVSIERNGERYLIKHGDTLGLISNDVYGTKAKWKKLWENNRQLIKDPNKIYAGFSLYYVPEARLTNEPKEEAPAVGGSAQNLPFKNAPVEKSVATAAPAAPMGKMPVNAVTVPVQDAARTPASSK